MSSKLTRDWVGEEGAVVLNDRDFGDGMKSGGRWGVVRVEDYRYHIVKEYLRATTFRRRIIDLVKTFDRK